MGPGEFVLILAGALLIAGAVVLAASRRVREIDRYRCPRCGYELEIRARQTCPECGSDLPRAELEPPTTERRSMWTATGACLVFFGLLILLYGAAGVIG